MSRVLVTGIAGYKGSVLSQKLIDKGHDVTGWDTCWFGSKVPLEVNLIVGDIRNLIDLKPYQAIIHLAGIANDPCGDLDAKLTWEVNTLATMRLADEAVKAGVKQFIYASSASVYGLKENKAVIETDSLEPVSDYNKTKQVSERALLSYSDKIAIQILRPATVCGMSPRMRLDTMVNMLTFQALKNGKIVAHCGESGGDLMRPNVHIEDITDLYIFMLEHPELQGIYNAGFENISALETAKMIATEIPSNIIITKVKDKRSYAVDSSKILAAGFRPRHTVKDAIKDISNAWKLKTFFEGPINYNLEWMRINKWAA